MTEPDESYLAMIELLVDSAALSTVDSDIPSLRLADGRPESPEYVMGLAVGLGLVVATLIQSAKLTDHSAGGTLTLLTGMLDVEGAHVVSRLPDDWATR